MSKKEVGFWCGVFSWQMPPCQSPWWTATTVPTASSTIAAFISCNWANPSLSSSAALQLHQDELAPHSLMLCAYETQAATQYTTQYRSIFNIEVCAEMPFNLQSLCASQPDKQPRNVLPVLGNLGFVTASGLSVHKKNQYSDCLFSHTVLAVLLTSNCSCKAAVPMHHTNSCTPVCCPCGCWAPDPAHCLSSFLEQQDLGQRYSCAFRSRRTEVLPRTGPAAGIVHSKQHTRCSHFDCLHCNFGLFVKSNLCCCPILQGKQGTASGWHSGFTSLCSLPTGLYWKMMNEMSSALC